MTSNNDHHLVFIMFYFYELEATVRKLQNTFEHTVIVHLYLLLIIIIYIIYIYIYIYVYLVKDFLHLPLISRI